MAGDVDTATAMDSDPQPAATVDNAVSNAPNDPSDRDLENPSPVKTNRANTTLRRTHTGTSTIIPRAKRSGLLSSLTIIPEIEDPTTYSPLTKSFIVFIVACAATSGPMSCGIILPALPGLETDLSVTPTKANLTVSLFLLGMGVSPLWLAYVSEHFGRRNVYIISFGLYTLFSLLCGFSNSIGTLLAFRLLAALASGSAQALGAGTIADIYVVQERGRAMGWFYIGPLAGPVMAPIIGGALTSAGQLAWRNTQWFLAGFAGLVFLMLTFCLPETLRTPLVLKIPLSLSEVESEASREEEEGVHVRMGSVVEKTRDPTRWEVFLHTALDPFKTFLFFKYPAVTCSIIYASTNFGLLYVMNISIEYGFSHIPYSFSTTIVGCLYLGNSLGYVLGSVLGGRWCDYVLARHAVTEDQRLVYVPEKRIGVNAWTGAALAPAGILLYGWTIEYGVIWIVPLIGTFFFGLGTMFIYSAVTTYLIDALPGRSSSAMALNNFVRNVLACAGSVAAVPLIDALGYGVLFSIVAGVLSLSAVLVLLIVLKGDAWRAKAEAHKR